MDLGFVSFLVLLIRFSIQILGIIRTTNLKNLFVTASDSRLICTRLHRSPFSSGAAFLLAMNRNSLGKTMARLCLADSNFELGELYPTVFSQGPVQKLSRKNPAFSHCLPRTGFD